MFEVGFSEMLLIGIVALIVLGPERLPRAARMVGLWVRRMRAYWFSMQAQLEQELAAEDLRKSLREAQDAVDEMKSTLKAPLTPPEAEPSDTPRDPS